MHQVLLRREVALGVQVISVAGPVEDADVPALRAAVADAAALRPRGVLLDLAEAEGMSAAAVQAMADLLDVGWGGARPSFQICCSAAELTAALSGFGPIHGRREDGLANADDRRSAPRQVIDLDSDLRSPAAARAATAKVVTSMHLEALSDDLALVVSELVTNAVRHAQPPVRLEIQADDSRVTVAVADGSPGTPNQRTQTSDAEGGRGMFLVDLLADETGCRPHPPGKTVWAALSRRR